MMGRRLWTVTVLSDEAGRRLRHVRLPRELARLSIAVALIAVAGISSLATVYLMDATPTHTDVGLQARNELLENELRSLTTKIDTLELSLDRLARQDELYRLLAGLEPTSAHDLLLGTSWYATGSVQSNPLYSVDQPAARMTLATSRQLSVLLHRARLLTASWRQAEDTLSERHARFNATPSISPAAGYISSEFSTSRWHPILERPLPHTGIDIVAAHGAPVVATARGRVETVGYHAEYGLTVDINHGYGVVTRYAHLSKTVVHVGEIVERGQQIGRVGQSGLAVGPHVHYEVLVNGRATNPRRYILERDVIQD
jgi:murein DD-endopeptidase MepM/ murein hydrolase activator NlpD